MMDLLISVPSIMKFKYTDPTASEAEVDRLLFDITLIAERAVIRSDTK
jgi:hypothetical protein